jgi:mRNA-degrading endonuclease RelE of RelBE toxin-antitoxin system
MHAYTIMLKSSAIADLDALRKYDATQIADAMEMHLRHNPTKESKSRIKRLRGISNPDYRLRAGKYRIFYVVDELAHRVDVLRIMHKDKPLSYYKELKQ